MRHIIITKDNLLSFSRISICILVPDIIDDDKIKITNLFTHTSLIFKWNKVLHTRYSTYTNNDINIFLCTSEDNDDYAGYKYRNIKLIKNNKLTPIV